MECGWIQVKYLTSSHTPPHTSKHTQPTGVIYPDGELAHLWAKGHQLTLSQDEELARRLMQEEEDQMTEEQLITRLSTSMVRTVFEWTYYLVLN